MPILMTPTNLTFVPIFAATQALTAAQRTALDTLANGASLVSDVVSGLDPALFVGGASLTFAVTDSSGWPCGGVSVSPPDVQNLYTVSYISPGGSVARLMRRVPLASIDDTAQNIVSGYDEANIYRPKGLIGRDPSPHGISPLTWSSI